MFGLNILGHISGEYGLGEAVRVNIRAMKLAGIPVSMQDIKVDWHRNLDKTYTEFSDTNPYPINFIHLNPEETREVNPEYFIDRYNIGFWAWESPIFPSDRHWAFDFFDEIWTPSSYSGDGIAMSSPIPVIRVPHNISLPQPSVSRKRLGLPEDRFIFLFMFDFHGGFARKNPLATIDAFRKAFGRCNEQVLLILKFSNSKYFPDEIAQIKNLVRGDTSIQLIDVHLLREEIDALMYNCDCYVSLHRSEGFGLTMAEAMYYGKPVIATGYSSNLEFMNINNSYLVAYDLVELTEDTGVFLKGNYWSDPDVDHASFLMKYVFENPQSSKLVGAKAALDIQSSLSPIILGQLIRNRLEKITEIIKNKERKSNSTKNYEHKQQSPQALAWKMTATYFYQKLMREKILSSFQESQKSVDS